MTYMLLVSPATARVIAHLQDEISLRDVGEWEKVVVRSGRHAKYSRLVFDWPAPVGCEILQEDDEIIITFDRPSEFDLSSAVDQLGAPLLDAQVEADGRRVVLKVEDGIEFRTHRFDGDVLAIDISESSRLVSTPSAQTPTVTGDPSVSETVAIRTGRHADHSRLVFDWSKAVGHEIIRSGSEITLTFDRPGVFDLSSVTAQIGKPLLETRVEAGGRRIVLTVEQGAEFHAHRYDGDVLGIDFFSADQLASQSPSRDETPKTASETRMRVEPAIIDGNKSKEASGDWAAGRAIDDPYGIRQAQFAVPKNPPSRRTGRQQETPSLAKDLRFEYVFGTEAELEYLRDLDLQRDLKDNSMILAPTVFGSVTYRPTDWLETWLEVTAEKLIAIHEEDPVILPDGSRVPADKKPLSILVDQAYARYKPLGEIYEVTFGRRNFEDQRLWLYDTALDGLIVTLKPGDFNIEASLTRENALDLDLTTSSQTSRSNNVIVYADYRGIEDHRLAGYWILQDDIDENPQLVGVRSIGRPTDAFNYWTEFALAKGRNSDGEAIQGHGYEAGGTYRFLDLPLQPSVTLGYAFGSGDSDPGDGIDDAFKQTGLGSNEGRFGGVTQFVTYGEALAPELSNIHIFTAGFGFRPTPGMFVDVVYHHYQFDELADSVRGSNLTTAANQIRGLESTEIGDGVDFIVGFRDLFGIRGLGFETRAGVFFPGKAFQREDGNAVANGNTAISVLLIAFF
jgi:alginate production protein